MVDGSSISDSVGRFCFLANQVPIVGFISGPVALITGVVKAALNGLAYLFSAIPSRLGCVKKDSSFHSDRFYRNITNGLSCSVVGLFITLPGTFLISCLAD